MSLVWKRKYRLASALVMTLVLSQCTDTDFAGNTGQPAPAQQPGTQTPGGSPGPGPGEGSQEGNPLPGVDGGNDNLIGRPPSPGASPGPNGSIGTIDSNRTQCTVNLNYRPEDVACALDRGGNNEWMSITTWRNFINAFPANDAKWLGPLAPIQVGGKSICPSVPTSDKLIYTTTFTVTQAGTHLVDAIVDDGGGMSIWRDGKSEQTVFAGGPNGPAHSVNLSAGKYTWVIEAEDVGGVGTAAVASIRGPSSQIVSRTIGDGSWCVFRVSRSVRADQFLPDAARCRRCFNPNL